MTTANPPMRCAGRRADEIGERSDGKTRCVKRLTDAPDSPHEPEYPAFPDELASEFRGSSGLSGQDEVYADEVARRPTADDARIIHAWWQVRVREKMDERGLNFEQAGRLFGLSRTTFNDHMLPKMVNTAWEYVPWVSDEFDIPCPPRVPEGQVALINEVLAADPVRIESAAQMVLADDATFEAMKECWSVLKSGVDPIKLKEFVALAAGMNKKPEH